MVDLLKFLDAGVSLLNGNSLAILAVCATVGLVVYMRRGGE